HPRIACAGAADTRGAALARSGAPAETLKPLAQDSGWRAMAVRLYFDVHVDKAIHDQLRLRGVDVLRAQDDGAAEMPDDEVLQHATDLGRLIFTQDIRFKALPKNGSARADHSPAYYSATS